MFKKDELKLEFKMMKRWANLMRRKPDEFSLLISNGNKNTKSKRVVKKGKGCNLDVKGIESQEVCGEIWIKRAAQAQEE